MKHPYGQYRRIVKELRGPYTQQEAALAAGVSTDLIQDWEAGRTRPKKPALRKLIDHYVTWCRHFERNPEPTRTRAITLMLGADDQDDQPADPGKEA